MRVKGLLLCTICCKCSVLALPDNLWKFGLKIIEPTPLIVCGLGSSALISRICIGLHHLQNLQRRNFLPEIVSGESKNSSTSRVLSFAERTGLSGSGSEEIDGEATRCRLDDARPAANQKGQKKENMIHTFSRCRGRPFDNFKNLNVVT